MPDNEHSIERKTLADWRKERGLTQRKVADLAGTTLATIWNIEHGRNNPTMDTAGKIARALGVMVDQIIWLEVKPFPSRKNRKPPRAKSPAA